MKLDNIAIYFQALFQRKHWHIWEGINILESR
jgi:hypothetical protein